MGTKKRWKDRKDGVYLRDIGPIHKIEPFIMPKELKVKYFSQRV